MSVYSIDWTKYRNIDYARCCALESGFLRHFHTDPILLEQKKKLEGMVRGYRSNPVLTQHFRTPYKFRKVDFYRKVLYEILKEEDEQAKEILEKIKDILFIYSKKEEEKEYLDYLLNHLEAEESHRQEQFEDMVEQFRNCD